jgi:hypothetical protein
MVHRPAERRPRWEATMTEEPTPVRRVTNTNAHRITVGLPFSNITIRETGEEVAELASLVARLARALADGSDQPELAALADEAEALDERLRA